MAKSKAKPAYPFPTGIVLLVFVTIVVFAAAAAFMRDYQRLPFGSALLIVWIPFWLLSATLAMLFFLQFVLPRRLDAGWYESLSLLFSSIGLLLTCLLPARWKPLPLEEGGAESIPVGFKLLGAGNVKSHQVLIISQRGGLTRVAGPGLVFLRSREKAAYLMDLRTHVRTEPVTLMTQDGIPVQATIAVAFRITPPPDAEEEKVPYSYSERNVLLAAQANSIDASGKVRLWSEQIAPQAATYCISEAGRYTLDRLAPSEAVDNVLGDIERAIKKSLRSNGGREESRSEDDHLQSVQSISVEEGFSAQGVTILRVRIKLEKLPPEIMQQRQEYRRVPGLVQTQIASAPESPQAIRRLSAARAVRHLERVKQILDAIDDELPNCPSCLPETILSSVRHAMETTLSSPPLHDYISEVVLSSLAKEKVKELRKLEEQT